MSSAQHPEPELAPITAAILSALIDDAEPFTQVFATCREIQSEVTVAGVFAELARMRELGWVELVLTKPAPRRTSDDISLLPKEYEMYLRNPPPRPDFDEIGLFCALTVLGRQIWRDLVRREPREGETLWRADEIPPQQLYVVEAATADLAETRLTEFLTRRRAQEQSREVNRAVRFELNDGTVVENGVRLSVRYRERNT